MVAVAVGVRTQAVMKTEPVAATTKLKPKTIELREGTLVVVFEGLKAIEDGPHKGQKTVGAVKVYVGGEQVGLLQHFKMEAKVNESLPRLEFDFGDHSIETSGGSDVWAHLRPAYERTIDRIKTFFPWAKWVSPVGSHNPDELPPRVEDKP